MAIPWIVGGIIAAGIAAVVASGDDDSSSSSSRDVERERERARRDNEHKKQKAAKQAKDQLRASKNKSTAQIFITKHKLSLVTEELISANKKDNQLKSLVMNAYDSKASVCRRNREIEVLVQDLETLEHLEKGLL